MPQSLTLARAAKTALVLLSMTLPTLVGGCEDGPAQPYVPAPANAASAWNGSGGPADGGAFAPDAAQGFDGGYSSGPSNDLCTLAQEQAIWSLMFQAPIVTPGLAGGLDLAGGPTGSGASGYLGPPFMYDPSKEPWTGVTVEQAEMILCQATPTSTFPGQTNEVGWGNSLEMNAIYDPCSRILQQLVMTRGYAGTLSAVDSQGRTWTVGLGGQPITLTSQGGTSPVILDWTDPTTFEPIVDSLFQALMGPTYPPEPGSCIDTGDCQIKNGGSAGGSITFAPLDLTIYTATTVGMPVENSTPTIVQIGLLKVLPFSHSYNLLKIDAVGPTSTTPDVQGLVPTDPNYGKTTTCKYTLGMDFEDFYSQCVQVFDATTNPSNYTAQNTIAERKLFGSMSHGDEAYTFDIPGVAPQFAGSSLAPTAVIADGQTPGDTDTAYQLTLDQNILGIISNDWQNNDPTSGIEDLHGFGMITLQWAVNVQHYLQAAYGVTTEIGDPRCLNLASGASPPKGVVCSGLEGIVTTAPPAMVSCPAAGTAWPDGTTSKCVSASQMSVNALGPLALQAGPVLGNVPAAASMASGMRPGAWTSLFCADAGGVVQGALGGYQQCVGGNAVQPQPASYFTSMQRAILRTGNFGSTASQLPVRDLGNSGFYFQEWVLALIGYLQSAGNPGATLSQMDGNPVDPDELVLTAAASGIETAEYVFRNDVNPATEAPLAVRVTADVAGGVISQMQFGRYNFRGEKALYTALTQTPSDMPGAENLYLTNIVGSPLLQSTFGTYACAIVLDPCSAACGASPWCGPNPPSPPPSSFVGYQGAFGQTVFNIAANGSAPTATPLAVDTSAPATPAGRAILTLPAWSNPFDPTTATSNDPTVSALVPYVPLGAGGGFPISINGSRDKFYDTAQLVLTGNTIDATVDLESVPFLDADGGVSPGWVIRAVQSSAFTGSVFPCVQSNPQNGYPDVLAVRMNDGASVVLDYLAKYPAAVSDCTMIVKYSPYGNTVEAISSLQYGVRLDYTDTASGPVVSDAILFDPNVTQVLGQ
jgi:hypothetical protein